MKVKNLTPFPFGTKVTSRRPPRPEMTLVLRACYVLRPGQPLAIPEGPNPLAQGSMRGDVFRDDDDERAGECLYPSDFADWKPRAEVLLRGTCHTPFGAPLTECPVRFSVGAWSKLLRVSGRRFWSDDKPGAVMSAAAPFTKMPIDYAHAFGGAGYAANPVGLGAASRELPNVEHAGVVIRARRDDPGPASFGPLNPAWPQRAPLVGKEYGPRWKKERSPYYAEDFSFSYFNAAPKDQQLEGYLRGDERLVFQNLHPDAQLFETALPGLRIRAFVQDEKRRFREVPMALDTLFADLDEGKLYLVWRGLDAVETDDLKDMLWGLVASEPVGEPKLPELHYRELLEAFERDPLEIAARIPGELLAKRDEMMARQKARDEGRPVTEHAAPPPDPMTANVRALLDRMPIALPNAKEIEASVAAAIANATARAPANVDAKAAIARAANDFAKQLEKPSVPAFPLRPGGPPPAWAANAVGSAFAEAARLRELADQGKLSEAQTAELVELERELEAKKKEPFFQAILNRPAYQEPGAGKDLYGQDYAGRDLRGMDLRAAILKDANLAEACLAGANLTLANVSSARAREAVFRDATLDRAFFQKADLRAAIFAGARGEAMFLPDADLTAADGKGARWVRAFVKGAVLADADFSDATLDRCLFLGVDGERARFARAWIGGTSFAGSKLSAASFASARGDGSVWLGATLHDADFTRAILPRAHFMEASALRARFRRAVLRDARCYRASFEHADFTESQLFGIDLTKCALGRARFNGACLYDAKLRQASGSGCDFTGANLKRALVEEP